MSGDVGRAVEEYAQTIRLCQKRLPSSKRGEAKAPSETRQARSSIENLRDMAIMRRALCERDHGRHAEAVAGLQVLLDRGDEHARRSALVMLAEWAQEEER